MENKVISNIEAMDMILSYCLEHPNEYVSIRQLQDNALPGVDYELMRYLFEQIDSFHMRVANISLTYDGEWIQSNFDTKPFVDNGGFNGFQSQRKSEQDRQDELGQIEFEKAKLDLELIKNTLNDYPSTKWMARLGFIIALGLAVLELIKFLGESP